MREQLIFLAVIAALAAVPVSAGQQDSDQKTTVADKVRATSKKSVAEQPVAAEPDSKQPPADKPADKQADKPSAAKAAPEPANRERVAPLSVTPPLRQPSGLKPGPEPKPEPKFEPKPEPKPEPKFEPAPPPPPLAPAPLPPAPAPVAEPVVAPQLRLFNQRNFSGTAMRLDQEVSNMQFSPRSARVQGGVWLICARPFFGGRCKELDGDKPQLNLPRAFSGIVRSARPLPKPAQR